MWQVAVWINPWWIVERQNRSSVTRRRSVTRFQQTQSTTWPSRHHPWGCRAPIAPTPRHLYLPTTRCVWNDSQWRRTFEELDRCRQHQLLPLLDARKSAASRPVNRRSNAKCLPNVSASRSRVVSRKCCPSVRRCTCTMSLASRRLRPARNASPNRCVCRRCATQVTSSLRMSSMLCRLARCAKPHGRDTKYNDFWPSLLNLIVNNWPGGWK